MGVSTAKAGQERANSALVLKVHTFALNLLLHAGGSSRQKYFISRAMGLPLSDKNTSLKCYGAPLLPASSPSPAWDVSRCEVGRDPLFRLNTCDCAMYDYCRCSGRGSVAVRAVRGIGIISRSGV